MVVKIKTNDKKIQTKENKTLAELINTLNSSMTKHDKALDAILGQITTLSTLEKEKKAKRTSTTPKTTSSTEKAKATDKTITSSSTTTTTIHNKPKSKAVAKRVSSKSLTNQFAEYTTNNKASKIGMSLGLSALTGGTVNPMIIHALGLDKQALNMTKGAFNWTVNSASKLLGKGLAKTTSIFNKKTPSQEIIENQNKNHEDLKKTIKEGKTVQQKKTSNNGILSTLLLGAAGIAFVSKVLKGLHLDPTTIVENIQGLIKQGGSKLLQWLFGTSEETANVFSDTLTPMIEGAYIGWKVTRSTRGALIGAAVMTYFDEWNKTTKDFEYATKELRKGNTNPAKNVPGYLKSNAFKDFATGTAFGLGLGFPLLPALLFGLGNVAGGFVSTFFRKNALDEQANVVDKAIAAEEIRLGRALSAKEKEELATKTLKNWKEEHPVQNWMGENSNAVKLATTATAGALGIVGYNKIKGLVSKKAVESTVGKAVTNTVVNTANKTGLLGKTLRFGGKALGAVGAGFGAANAGIDAYEAYKSGDYKKATARGTSSAIHALSTGLMFVPGAGWVAAGALELANGLGAGDWLGEKLYNWFSDKDKKEIANEHSQLQQIQLEDNNMVFEALSTINNNLMTLIELNNPNSTQRVEVTNIKDLGRNTMVINNTSVPSKGMTPAGATI